VMVTPRIFTVVVRSMPGIGGGGCTRVFRLLSKKTTSKQVKILKDFRIFDIL